MARIHVMLALLVAVPVWAQGRPSACQLDLGPIPLTPRARVSCERKLRRLCRLCERYPGMTICVTGAACDEQSCGSYTPNEAECAAGMPLPCVPTAVSIPTTTTLLP